MKIIINFASSVLLLMCAFIILPTLVFAQMEIEEVVADSDIPTDNIVVLSTVNIQDAAINSQTGNQFNISFNFSNKEIIQNGVRYGVRLIKETANKQIIVDEFVYPEEISLPENSVTSKIINYSASEYLSGSYKMYIIGANKNGFPVGMTFVNDVELNATKAGVIINPETCALNVAGTGNGVDSSTVSVGAEEDLRLSCLVSNQTDQSVTVVPDFMTYKNSIYGDAIPNEVVNAPATTFGAGEEKTLSISVPKMTEARDYVLTMALMANESVVSNTIIKNYSIKGFSATIDNVWIDKDIYKLGETANVSLMWQTKNDDTTTTQNVVFDVTLINTDGTFCSDTASYTLPSERDVTKFLVPITVAVDCVNPSVLAVLKDESGNIFDQISFTAGYVEEIATVETDQSAPTSMFKSSNVIYLIGLIAVSFVVLFILLKYVRKDNFVAETSSDNSNSTKTFLFALTLIAVGGMIPANVSAITFCANQDPRTNGFLKWCNTINVNLDKSSYVASSDMNVAVSVGTGVAYSLEGTYTVDGRINEVTSNYTNYLTTYYLYPNAVYGNKIITAPASVGDYNLEARAKACQTKGGCYNSYWTFANGYPHIPFKVTAPAVVAPSYAEINLNKTSVLKTDSFTATWSGNNSPTYYNVKVGSVEYGMGSAVSWTGTPTALSLGVGSHSFYAQACNTAGCSPWSAGKTLTVTDLPPPAPTLTFTASPTTVNSGSASTLTWTTTNATACSASGAWSGAKLTGTNRTESTGALTSAKTYTLTCSNSSGSVVRSVTVNVSGLPPPPPGSSYLRICPDTTNLTVGEMANLKALYWSSLGSAPTCSTGGSTDVTTSATWSGSNAGVASVNNTGSNKGLVTALSAGSVIVTGSYSGVGDTASVNVSGLPPPPPPQPPIIDITVEPSVVRVNGTANVEIEVTTDLPATCTHYGIKDVSGTLSHDGSPASQDWNLVTKGLINTQIVKVVCIVNGYSVSSEATERINVIPNLEET